MIGRYMPIMAPPKKHQPHVELEVAHPPLPQGGVLLVVGEGDADRLDLALLAAQAGQVADPGAHAVALVAVVVHHIPVQPGRQRREPGQAAEQGGVAALGWQGGGDEPAEAVPPDAERDDEQVDDEQEGELDADRGEVGQLQAAGDLARDHGDAHHHQQQQDGEQRHRGRVVLAGDAAVEQGEQPLGGGLGPATPDEGEEERDQRERNPQRGAWRHPAEAHDGHLAGGHHMTGELDVVEDLQQGRDGDDPADADEPEGADVQRAEQPLATADRDPERDQARAEDELDHLLAAEVADVEDLLGVGRSSTWSGCRTPSS
jgi:hypothetical protein